MELYSTYGYCDPKQDCYLDALPDRNIGYLICMKNRTKACTQSFVVRELYEKTYKNEYPRIQFQKFVRKIV